MVYKKNLIDIADAAAVFNQKVEQLSSSGIDVKDICFALVEVLKNNIMSADAHLVQSELISFSRILNDPTLFTYEVKNEIFFTANKELLNTDLSSGDVLALKVNVHADSHSYYDMNVLENILGSIGVRMKRSNNL